MLKISALYLIGKAEIPIHYTTWGQVEQALLSFSIKKGKKRWLKSNKNIMIGETILLLSLELWFIKDSQNQENFSPPPSPNNNRKFFQTIVGVFDLISQKNYSKLKSIFSKKATKFDKIFIFDLTLCSKCQIDGEDFVNFCGFLRKQEL